MSDSRILRLLEGLEQLIDDTLERNELDADSALGILRGVSALAEGLSVRGDDEIVRLLWRMKTIALNSESRNEAALDLFVKDGWSLSVELERLLRAAEERTGKTRFETLDRSGCGASRQGPVGS